MSLDIVSLWLEHFFAPNCSSVKNEIAAAGLLGWVRGDCTVCSVYTDTQAIPHDHVVRAKGL